MSFTVNSPNVKYTEDEISSVYRYQTTKVEGRIVTPVEERLVLKTQRKVPKVGLMLVGWGGNNGTTVTAGILANKHNISWQTKEGIHKPDYFGSLTQASTVRLGFDAAGESVYIPFSDMLPMVHPNDLVLGGWDISSMNLADALVRAKVIDYDLQRQLFPYMKSLVPLPSIYNESYIALNQQDRADNVIPGNKQVQLDTLRRNIREFKTVNDVDKVIVLWTATTERYSSIIPGVNDTAEALLKAIEVSVLSSNPQ